MQTDKSDCYSLLCSRISAGAELFFGRCTHGAGVCAGTAGHALVRVDHILAVAFGNAADRASIGAGTAADAFVGNLISHGFLPPYEMLYLIVSYLRKKSRAFSKIISLFGKKDGKSREMRVRNFLPRLFCRFSLPADGEP